MIAAALDGIERELDPGPLFSGDAYEDASLPRVPETLPEAIRVFEESDFVKRGFRRGRAEPHRALRPRRAAAPSRSAVTDWEEGALLRAHLKPARAPANRLTTGSQSHVQVCLHGRFPLGTRVSL